MKPTEKFAQAGDQAQVAREMFAEMFFDEDETYWLVAEGRTSEEAAALVSNIEPNQGRQTAALVRGVLGTRYGESWFQKAADGPVAMWEVTCS